MWEPHQREPRNRWCESAKPHVECPFCGKPAIVKELRYTGKRENLSSYRRAVVLRWYRGALWARAYDCGKHYTAGYDLAGDPTYKLVGVYRFRPGLAEATTRSWYGDSPFGHIEKQDGPLTKGRWNIHAPFSANADYGIGYDVIGLDEIQERFGGPGSKARCGYRLGRPQEGIQAEPAGHEDVPRHQPGHSDSGTSQATEGSRSADAVCGVDIQGR